MLSVRIKDDLMDQIKERSKDTGKTIQVLVEETLEEEFGKWWEINEEVVKEIHEREASMTPEQKAKRDQLFEDYRTGKIKAWPDGVPMNYGTAPTDEEFAEIQERTKWKPGQKEASDIIIEERGV